MKNSNKCIAAFLIITIAGGNLFSFCHSCKNDKYDIHFIAQSCKMGECTRDKGTSHCDEENCNHQPCKDQIVNENYLTLVKQFKSGLPVLTSSASCVELRQSEFYINIIFSDFYLLITCTQRNPVLRI
jgi:hypothetical protein